MTGLQVIHDGPDRVPGRHLPDCDSRLGPTFSVEDDTVTMTQFLCTGCLPVGYPASEA